MTETTVLTKILDEVMEPIFRRQPVKFFLNRFDKWALLTSLALLVLESIFILLFNFAPVPETQWLWYKRLAVWSFLLVAVDLPPYNASS